MADEGFAVRFYAKVDRSGPHFIDKDGVDHGPCWLWTGAKDQNGYGRFRFRGRSMAAHRVAYGPVAEGLTVDHRCRRRDCVRRSHLQAVTAAVNLQRRVVRNAVTER